MFTYDVALKYVKEAEKVLNIRISAQKPEQEINKAKATLERCLKMTDLVRDITLLHAIATDKDDLFEPVMKADGKEPQKLGAFAGNSEICDLLDEDNPNPKIRAWRLNQWNKGAAQREANAASAKESMARARFFQEKVQTTLDDKAAKDIAATERLVEVRLDRIDAAIKVK